MQNTKDKNSIQVIHDLFKIKGGGERLVKTLCQHLDTDLLTAHIGDDTFDLSEITGSVHNLDALSRIHGVKTWSLARAFSHYKPVNEQYKHIIYSGVAAPLAVKNYTNANHVFYCHTPPRFIYDKKAHYESELNLFTKPVFKALFNWFKPQYESAIAEMDHVLTNSKFVQQRISDNLNIDSQVVYPPCDTQYFKWQKQGDYFLSLARHDELKRIDKIIDAFKQLPDKKLIVASGGVETDFLKNAADGYRNIHFTGWLSEDQLLKLLGECLATIYIPKDEDFGMSPVESMSAGKPVFCSDHGGLLESIIDGETGFYIDENNLTDSLIEKINHFNGNQADLMKTPCEKQAKLFDTQVFIKNIKNFL